MTTPTPAQQHIEALRELRTESVLCDIDPVVTDALDYALAALEAVEWRPIETAPNSGKVVIFSAPTRGIPIMARGDDYWLNRVEGKGTAYWLDGATHWMPLPAPPADAMEVSRG